jgi:hypothetical protein
VYGGEELLQIVSAAAFLGNPIERRTQCLHSLAVGNVVVTGVVARHLPIQQKGRTRHGYIEQGPIFFSSLRFQCDALAFCNRLGHPPRLREPVGRNHQILERMSYHLGHFVAEHVHKSFIGHQDTIAAVGDAQSVGRCLKYLFQKLQTSVRALSIFIVYVGVRRQRARRKRARSLRGRGTVSRLNKGRRSSALQGFLQPVSVGKVRPS